jgi:hypothetical protein
MLDFLIGIFKWERSSPMMKIRQRWVRDDILDNLFVQTWRHL